ncbi:hypothetical protein EDD29_5587 [Actinocorallia herbida]|uniref:Uncharacterized protein n=1 Tax=Actinocorallia herbida TaxID=58109 RepID=A0A3N1D4C8_9ACTN|nr:hypothetical protein [Actinocorallia herbida]ROO87938.1 hypothetical protein EDD29_5587 [Actinocorallia herbida]
MPDTSGQPLEDDHDLLTRDEAAERLRSEIDALRADLSAYRHGADEESAARARRSEQRLTVLLGAQRRNATAQAEASVSGFFAYRGPGK